VDNVCHTLAGAALSRAGLGGRTRFGPAALLVSANLPDLDVLVFATEESALAFRRGWTHGVAAQVVLPLLLTGVLWLTARSGSRSRVADPVRPAWLLALSYFGVLSHVLLDWLNTYGVRLLAPFDWRWFYGDAVFIIDPWLWLVLGAGVWLARRRGSEGPARAAIVVAFCYIAAMYASGRLARAAAVESWLALGGRSPEAIMVGPVPAWPFAREVILDAGDAYVTGRLTFPSRVEWSPDRVPKSPSPRAVAAASRAGDVRGFLVWSRFPYWTVEPAGDRDEALRVTVGDMRFRARGGERFSASVVVPDD